MIELSCQCYRETWVFPKCYYSHRKLLVEERMRICREIVAQDFQKFILIDTVTKFYVVLGDEIYKHLRVSTLR